jgi:hypothetical protein
MSLATEASPPIRLRLAIAEQDWWHTLVLVPVSVSRLKPLALTIDFLFVFHVTPIGFYKIASSKEIFN